MLWTVEHPKSNSTMKRKTWLKIYLQSIMLLEKSQTSKMRWASSDKKIVRNAEKTLRLMVNNLKMLFYWDFWGMKVKKMLGGTRKRAFLHFYRIVFPGLQPRHKSNFVKLLKENYQTEIKSGGYSSLRLLERGIFKWGKGQSKSHENLVKVPVSTQRYYTTVV